MIRTRLHDYILAHRGPLSLSRRAWGDVLRRTWRAIGDDNLSLIAAGSAFFGLLALAPALTALVSIWALFADPATLTDHLLVVDQLLPRAAYEVVSEQMVRIAEAATGALGWGAVVSLLLMLWSANQGTRAFMSAFNVIYGERETRNLVKLTLHSLLLTSLGVAVTAVALALVVGLPAFFTALGFDQGERTGAGFMRWPTLFGAVFVFYLLLGRFAPNRPDPRWRWLWPGAAASALVWLLASGVFSLYVEHIAGFNAVYGSLGAIVVLLLWMYLSIFVGLIGAKMNAELERETFVDPAACADKTAPKIG